MWILRKGPKRIRRRRRPHERLVYHPNQHYMTHIGKLRKARKMARETYGKKCSVCTSYYPRTADSWDCLSGMPCVHPCEEYEFAIFQLVPGWKYSVHQLMVMRKAEEHMKRAEGKKGM